VQDFALCLLPLLRGDSLRSAGNSSSDVPFTLDKAAKGCRLADVSTAGQAASKQDGSDAASAADKGASCGNNLDLLLQMASKESLCAVLKLLSADLGAK
jgi:hypothetical protein